MKKTVALLVMFLIAGCGPVALLVMFLIAGCGPSKAELQAKEQVATLLAQVQKLQERERIEVSNRLDLAKKYRERARARVILDHPWQRARLELLEAELDKIGFPEDGARMENNMFRCIQRQAQFWMDAFKYDPTGDGNRVIDPAYALNAMKSFIEGTAKIAKNADMAVEGIAYQFGDDEGYAIRRIDLTAIQTAVPRSKP